MSAKAIDRGEVLPFIYAEVASGRSLDNVLTDEGMPSPSTFWRWHMEDEDIRDNLARARENGVERHLGEIVRIADEVAEEPASRRVRIDARVKAAQMIAPRKYGPKLDLTSGGEKLSDGLDPVARSTRLAAIFADIERRRGEQRGSD